MRKQRFFCLMMLLALVAVIPAAAQDDAFPVTIEHKFGSTTIPEAPERVVSIGYTDQDALFALGVAPIAVRYWYGDAPNAIFPWAADEAGEAMPEVLEMPYGNLNYEAILALQPDLIIAVGAGITQEEFDLLSEIAPTVAQSPDYIDFGMPWQETTRMIGAAVGKTAEAEALIERVEGLFAEAREQNPAYEGQTLALAYNYGEDRTYGFYSSQDSRARFFTDLGFVVPQELEAIAGEQFYADLSTERIDLLDQDLLVFLGLQFAQGGREAIETDPLLSQLNAIREERVVYIPAEYDDALQFSTVLSLEYALEGILPELQAVAGSSETASAQAAIECEAGFRAFDHEFLATDPLCVPEDPQRIVIADFAALDLMYTLDIAPVGVWNLLLNGWYANMVPELLPSLEAYVGDAADIGAIPLNVEAILAADPDLILVNSLLVPDDAAYEQLSAIAPTVVKNETNVDDWREYIRFYGEALNVAEETEALLADYEARLQALIADSNGAFDGQTASLIQVNDPATIYLNFPNYRGWVPLRDVGFVGSEAQLALMNQDDGDNTPNIPLSNEEVALLDTDYVILMNAAFAAEDSTANQELYEAYQTDPLWSALPAVQNGRFYLVDLAWQANGLISGHAVIDDMYRLFLNMEPTTPNPYLEQSEATETP
ncbi:MAG: iron-siderophore ABC transporter substrate-binding protein [bacterium]|nr:iron-siderophore ABC transporter substrate-binding protein [bacterium]